MKKRLRKKLHKAEFAEFFVRYSFSVTEPSEFDFDTVIQAADNCGCGCFGSFNANTGKGSICVEFGLKSERDAKQKLFLAEIKQLTGWEWQVSNYENCY